jgi:hypothetical protein
MQDMAVHPTTGAVLVAMLDNPKKLVAAVCHGPAGLLPASRPDGTWALKDRQLTGFSNLEETQAGFAATVDAGAVFVGYGVTAPEFQYDDYAGADVKGKVAVVLRGGPARFPSTERAYFASALTAQQNAVAHAAAGVFACSVESHHAPVARRPSQALA